MAWRLLFLSSFVLMTVFNIGYPSQAADCDQCLGQCDAMTGRCSGACNTSSFGEKCDKKCPCPGKCDKFSGRCESCDYYTYGDYCNNTCSDGCSFSGCDRDTGICKYCRYNLYGDYCNNTCPAHCEGCEQSDGSCKNCERGYWGNKCESKCPINCKYSDCKKVTGKCKYCKPSYRGEFCEIKCPYENCKSCYWSTYENKEKCKCFDGFYGDKCDRNCSDACWNNECMQNDGKCYTCKDGYFGIFDFCKEKCFENCAKCTDNQTCTKCMDGYFGKRCEHKCPSGCGKCTRDGRLCLSCKDTNYENEDLECSCNKNECTPDMSYCSGCKNSSWFSTNTYCCPCKIRHCANEDVDVDNCRGRVSGNCAYGCKPGYFGTLCGKKCSPHCGGFQHRCDVLGECIEPCEEGWAGPKCDIHCTYLPHCIKCTTDKKSFDRPICLECEENHFLSSVRDRCLPCHKCDVMCNMTTGKCPDCSKGYHHDAFGYCYLTCENCIDQECHLNGSCVKGQCKPGYYGDHCDWTCSPNCRNKSCDIKTGKCILGCENGFFGDKCQELCQNCLNDECDVKTGKCFECKPTFFGSSCSDSCAGCIDGICEKELGCYKGCKPGKYSFLCNKTCQNDCRVCDQVTGSCRLCLHSNPACLRKFRIKWDLTKDLYKNASSCIAGMYGPNCDVPCPKGCFLEEYNAAICDRYTGTCPMTGCKSHLYGLHCNFDCQFCGSGHPSCHRTEGYCEVCEDGYHGKHCVLKCAKECLGGACHQKTAECTNGCQNGWMGSLCNLKMEDPPKDSPMSNTTLTVVIVICILLVIALIIFGIIVVLRNASRRRGQYNGTSTSES